MKALYLMVFTTAASLLGLLASAATPGSTAGVTSPDITAHLLLRNIGPAFIGGRVSAVTGVAGDPGTFYVGAAGGGVWKTTDGGDTWQAIFAHEATSSIGAIAVAPSDPHRVWVGTGESDIRNDVIDGRGVYYSPDAGKTWRRMGLEDAGQISRVVIDPDSPTTVYVAALGHAWGPNAQRGVFRTRDGGKTWDKVLYENDHTGAIDLAISPGDSKVLYAAMWQVRRRPWALDDGGPGSGIYRSTDGGDHWRRLTRGLPPGRLGRIGIAIAPSNPRHLYALIEAPRGRLWASTDGGDRWQLISDDHALDQRPFYFSRLAVAPDDEAKVYFCALDLRESDDGGKTSRAIDSAVHGDHHALWIDPHDPRILLQGNDGGVYLSRSGGKSWRYLNNLPIEQLYTVSADNSTPYQLCTGAQDNGAWCGPSSDLARHEVDDRDWYLTTNGDGQYAVAAPSDPRVIYSDAQLGYIQRWDRAQDISTDIRPSLVDAGFMPVALLPYRFNWTTPFAVSPSEADTVYLGANVVFKTTDGGEHWEVISPDLTRDDKAKQQLSGGPIEHDLSGAENYDSILSLTLAPSDSRVIWAGTDDGLLWMSRGGGANRHWTNVTPPGAPPWARVYQIGVSPFAAGTAYVAFDAHMLDDRHPYVYETEDYGRTWHAISAGLPRNETAVVVREDPDCPGLLVLGTETGLYFSYDSGQHWQRFGGDFPTVPVWDLAFIARDHALAVATHGRGLFTFDDLRPLEGFKALTSNSGLRLFSPAPGVLFHVHYVGRAATPAYSVPTAPTGVLVSYFLKAGVRTSKREKQTNRTPVEITFADATGHTLDTQYGPANAGLNQFEWPLTYHGPAKLEFIGRFGRDRSPTSGPEVLPGRYRVTVTVRGESVGEWITVRPDPQHHVRARDLARQTQLALEVDAEIDALNRMLNCIMNIRGVLHKAAARADISEAARTLDARLAVLEASVFNPRMAEQSDIGAHDLEDLQQQLSSLLDAVSETYGEAPDLAELQLSHSLTARLNVALVDFNRLLSTDLLAYSELARRGSAPILPVADPIHVKSIPLP